MHPTAQPWPRPLKAFLVAAYAMAVGIWFAVPMMPLQPGDDALQHHRPLGYSAAWVRPATAPAVGVPNASTGTQNATSARVTRDRLPSRPLDEQGSERSSSDWVQSRNFVPSLPELHLQPVRIARLPDEAAPRTPLEAPRVLTAHQLRIHSRPPPPVLA